jgi:hypothetical protein
MAAIIICIAIAAGCHNANEENSKYKDDSLWLCKPGLTHNYCLDDLTATEILPDNSHTIRTHEPAQKTDVIALYLSHG